ncbi:MAG: N-acetylmuramoyl-L-alanine amidase [Bacteroidales bacterium]|nr:N-acetylmuramoyl-L-alanine amidase [Bacteroidales bacterium]
MKAVRRLLIFIVFSLLIVCYSRYRDVTGVFSTDTDFRKTTKYIIIHHDDICRETCIKEINDYHRDSCGWSCGFAYNLYIKDGKVFQVHDLNAALAHTKGYNHQAVGVCFHTADKQDLQTQVALIITIKFLMIKYNIPKERVVGHCDLNTTKCPGIDLNKLQRWL